MANEIGLIGLGVMGQNLALNIASRGVNIAVWNRSTEKIDLTVKQAQSEGIQTLHGYQTLQNFVNSLQVPRTAIIMVNAGKPVDEVIKSLSELMEPTDLIIDAGNELFSNTEQRAKRLYESKQILYMGMGVSGGEYGARHGPSIMPGGTLEAYERVKPILLKIAAYVDGHPCVTYIGSGGSGNYVKMIHNGIEYADMQLIAEAYNLLKNIGGLTNQELHETFNDWNKKDLESYLIEITANIFNKQDDQPNQLGHLVDKIKDSASSKGTGKWTVQQSMEQGISASIISSACDARYMSGYNRKVVSDVFPNNNSNANTNTNTNNSSRLHGISKENFIQMVYTALYSAKICAYSQGMDIIKSASNLHNWNLNLCEIARIWKGGCIIRAKFLDRIVSAYQSDPNLMTLLIDPEFASDLNGGQCVWRGVVSLAITEGIPVPAFSSALSYFDTYRSTQLPANLTQAQRDYFGSHTYERNDMVGTFHTEW